MAYDKAVDSAALDAGLTAIANAIREKAGSSDALAFPDAMAAAIAGISAGGKVTYGTITPIEQIRTIEHNLGVKPYMFMWFVTFNNTMTGRIIADAANISTGEQAYDTADISGYTISKKMVFILMNNRFYGAAFSSNTDWGFFSTGDMDKLITDIDDIELNETVFISGKKTGNASYSSSIIPFDTNGNITINWFAIG